MTNNSLEQATAITTTPESASAGLVVQPSKVEYVAFLDGISKMTENANDNPSGDWSGAAGGAVATTGGSQGGISPREHAIAHLPIPVVMQKDLETHIRAEVKKLRKQALSIATMSHPGGAYKLNQLYARIRHMNAILASLFEASVEVIKRLYIRVFIDKQTIQ
jgi:hypothetical protein